MPYAQVSLSSTSVRVDGQRSRRATVNGVVAARSLDSTGDRAPACPTSRPSTASRSAGTRSGRRQGTYRFDRTAERADVYADRHPAADRVAAACTWATSSATRTPTCIARYQRMRGKARLLPDGLGRQRPADRAPGAELLRRALRPVPAVRPGVRAAGRRRRAEEGHAAGQHQPAELRRAVPAADRRGREGLRGRCSAARPVGRLGARPTRRSATGRGGPPSARSCATSPAARRTPPRRRRCGTSTSRPPSRRPSSRTASSPAPTTAIGFAGAGRRAGLHRDHPPRAAAGLRRAGGAPRRRALPAAVRHDGDARRCSASRCRCIAHELAEPDKGSGIAMICTFGDTTDVTWWRELDLPVRSIVGRDGRLRARRRRSGVAARAVRRAGRQDRQAGAEAHRRAARRGRRPRRRAASRSPTR